MDVKLSLLCKRLARNCEILAVVLGLVSCSSDGILDVPEPVDHIAQPLVTPTVTLLDYASTFRATYYSNRNLVVPGRDGKLLAAYIMSFDETSYEGIWRLKAYDGAGWTEKWTSLSQGTLHTTAPSLVVHPTNGDLYAGYVNIVAGGKLPGQAFVRRFSASLDYSGSLSRLQTISSREVSGKFALLYDSWRDRLLFSQYRGKLDRINPYGTMPLEATWQVYDRNDSEPGQRATAEYPYLQLGGSTVFLGQMNHSKYANRYHSLHIAKTEDGGPTWKTLAGGSLPLPFEPDDTKTYATQVNYNSETYCDKWQPNIFYHAGKLHSMYLGADLPTNIDSVCGSSHHVYTRFSPTGTREVTTWNPQGATLQPDLYSSFFTASGGNLYIVGRGVGVHASQLVVIKSTNNGNTWVDHAVTDASYPELGYVVGGQATASDGSLVGMFNHPASGAYHVEFFRIAP